ncbi:hypothetical protein [uncultured Paludibaculum sp.]|nr:hypothetical protein [uncultured Paludibaculum sp.]
MAKIKPAGGKKASVGPKNPGAVGCLILIGSILVLVCLVMYFSLSRS